MMPDSRDPKSQLMQKIEEVFIQLKNISLAEKKIALSTIHGIEFILLEDIIRLESQNNRTMFWLNDNTKKIGSGSIGHFDKTLNEYYFFRIHQSHIINLVHVKSYSKTDGGSVTMSDGITMDVSRRKRKDLMKRLNELIC